MVINLTKTGPPLSEADLQGVEQRYGLKFPLDYRQFLLRFNGGKPDKCLFRFKGKRVYSECVHYFLSMSDNPDISFHVYYKSYKIDSKRLQPDVIPVAFDPGGNLICLSVAGKNVGTVFFWDHEQETSERGEFGKNQRVIAGSFREFLGGLKFEARKLCTRLGQI